MIRLRLLLSVFGMLLVTPLIVTAGVVSSYKINGQTISEGVTFDELRAVAGDPLAVEPINGNQRYVEWVYHCARSSGPCKVVTEGGKREMRARFSLGRLKGIQYQRL